MAAWTGRDWPDWVTAAPAEQPPDDTAVIDTGDLSGRYSIATHRRGIAWDEAPLPWRWHRRCQPQTSQRAFGHLIQRCRCGAIRQDLGQWSGVNSRRRWRD